MMRRAVAVAELAQGRDVVDTDLPALRFDAQVPQAGKRAGQSFRLHAEALGDHRLVEGQADKGRTRIVGAKLG